MGEIIFKSCGCAKDAAGLLQKLRHALENGRFADQFNATTRILSRAMGHFYGLAFLHRGKSGVISIFCNAMLV
ncbi:hypothetical protein [Magnetovibrio sp.]|uniref:hypothetical protein n=1 Tax=Magnetovibrio sp. TaxID=2024836 RepID=UPI002F9472FB